ncbi:FAD-binding protein [Streptomyces sp. NPDC006510]|uniref:FAD-binding protein n=1 Tax=Streptomyces sp. NPDC006510 TaxID=3155600 RepID=UPI0033AD3EE3
MRAASAHDGSEAVAPARSGGLRVAVRSGGHSWCDSSVRSDGMPIDLSGLRRCGVDAASATATVRPAVTGSRLAP